MFCVKCGNESETIDGLCVKCFLNGRNVIDVPHHADLERCTNCEEFLINGRWSKIPVDEAIEDAAMNSLKMIAEAEITDIEVDIQELDQRNHLVTIDVESNIHGIASSDTAEITVRVKNTVCKRCSRQLGNYYEATLQIRSAGKLDDHERDTIVRMVRDRVEQMAESNRQRFITKVEEVPGGIDMQMSSISMTRALAKQIAESYGGDFKESSKLVGKTSDGEDLYRLTYLVRLPDYHVGDAVTLNGIPYVIRWIGRNGAKATDLRDFRDTVIKRNDLRDIRPAVRSVDMVEAVVISRSEREVQILHPSNYSTVDIRIPADADIGDTVRIAIIDDDIHMVP